MLSDFWRRPLADCPADCGEESVKRLLLADEVRRTSGERIAAHGLRVVDRDDDDLTAGVGGAQLSRGGHAVHACHLDIHQDDIGVEGIGGAQRGSPVACLAHYFDIRFKGKPHTPALPHAGLVIHEQQPDRRIRLVALPGVSRPGMRVGVVTHESSFYGRYPLTPRKYRLNVSIYVSLNRSYNAVM
jgi:hypothetical protein